MAITVENAREAQSFVGRNVALTVGKGDKGRVVSGTIDRIYLQQTYTQEHDGGYPNKECPAHWRADVKLIGDAFSEVNTTVEYLTLLP